MKGPCDDAGGDLLVDGGVGAAEDGEDCEEGSGLHVGSNEVGGLKE